MSVCSMLRISLGIKSLHPPSASQSTINPVRTINPRSQNNCFCTVGGAIVLKNMGSRLGISIRGANYNASNFVWPDWGWRRVARQVIGPRILVNENVLVLPLVAAEWIKRTLRSESGGSECRPYAKPPNQRFLSRGFPKKHGAVARHKVAK